MTEIITSKHYVLTDSPVEIEFLPNSHAYRLAGTKERLPSVTSCTGLLDKSRVLMGWATRLAGEYLQTRIGETLDPIIIELAISQYKLERDRTADIGSQAHKWAENDINNIKQDLPEDESVLNAVLGYIKWKDEHKPKFLFSEKKVYSKKYGYVGTMDLAFTLESEGHAINHSGDFKTASGCYPEMCAQISAYQEAETEEFGTVYGSKYILRFDRDEGTFEAREFPAEQHQTDFMAFLNLLELKQWVKETDKLLKSK